MNRRQRERERERELNRDKECVFFFCQVPSSRFSLSLSLSIRTLSSSLSLSPSLSLSLLLCISRLIPRDSVTSPTERKSEVTELGTEKVREPRERERVNYEGGRTFIPSEIPRNKLTSKFFLPSHFLSFFYFLFIQERERMKNCFSLHSLSLSSLTLHILGLKVSREDKNQGEVRL